MPSSTVNICVFTLVLLSAQQFCDSRPSKTKREINKDYSHPLSGDHFERRADDKYYLKKSAHKIDSEVKYVGDEKNGASPNDLKSPVVDIAKEKADLKIEKEPLKAVETEKVDLEVAVPKPISPPTEEAKDVKELSPKSDAAVDEAVKKGEIKEEKAPFTPVDPKFLVPAKPDSKDEIEVKTNLPPTSSEEEKVGEKVDIGQIPHMYPRLIPIPNTFRVPILIPIQKIAYGAVSVVPLPPAAISDRLPLPPAAASDRLPLPPIHDVSDRLPLSFEDDIVGEGGPESAEMEEAAELAAERKVEKEGYPVHPLPLSLLSFGGLLKDLKDASFKEGEKETKVVDVLGKKFVMQSNVVKYPSSGNGHTFIRFLSVKPLEKVEKDIIKEADSDKSTEDETLEVKAKEAADEFSAKKDEGLKNEGNFEKVEKSEVEKETVTEMVKEPEILKAEETQIRYNVHPEVPKEIVLKETVEMNLKKEGGDLVEEQTEKTEDVLNDEKMVEVKHSFVEEQIKTEKGVKAESSEEVESAVLKMKPDIEGGELVYRIKIQQTEEEKKKLKGDDGDLSDEAEGSKEMITVEDSFVEKSGKDDMIESSKKEYFLPEKKKKELTKGDDKLKYKKSTKEKKSKKKCTCEEEEEDSGSDYSSVESDDDY